MRDLTESLIELIRRTSTGFAGLTAGVGFLQDAPLVLGREVPTFRFGNHFRVRRRRRGLAIAATGI
jgi:hypothetical protein